MASLQASTTATTADLLDLRAIVWKRLPWLAVAIAQGDEGVGVGGGAGEQLAVAFGQIYGEGIGGVGIGMARQGSGQDALAAAAVDRAGIGIGRAVERQPDLTAAPIDAAGGDDPDFGVAAGQSGRRFEQHRRVGVARVDERIERRAGGYLF